MHSNKLQSSRGFTLLEVMIALMVFSIIAVVFQKATSQTLDQYYRVKFRTFATWIAENKLTQMRLSNAMPLARQYKEKLTFSGIHWRIKTQVSKTADPNMMRVDIHVFNLIDSDQRERQAGTLSGVIGRY